jgi:hypothetical protein
LVAREEDFAFSLTQKGSQRRRGAPFGNPYTA